MVHMLSSSNRNVHTDLAVPRTKPPPPTTKVTTTTTTTTTTTCLFFEALLP